MYTDIDFKTKKALREAFKSGKQITVYQPGGIFASQTDGVTVIEGPHGYRRWYAEATIKDGVIVKMK